MTTHTNESNEAYERRMEIRELMSAPKGTQFEECSFRINGEYCWHTSTDPKWDFENRLYRIAPTPKKVLRPAWEILREAMELGFVSKEPHSGAIRIGIAEKTYYLGDFLDGAGDWTGAPDWFFINEDTKR